MHSPPSRPERGDPADADRTVQGILEAFERFNPTGTVDPHGGGSDDGMAKRPWGVPRQSSIDAFSKVSRPHPSDGAPRSPPPASRAIDGLALEAAMEGIALSEASMGVARDELVITIVRECHLPVELLDIVDAYVRDLELEGRLRRVDDVVVLARKDDADLMAMGLDAGEFLERYRRRYRSLARGGEP